MLQIVNHTPFNASLSVFADPAGVETAYAVVKATFALGADGPQPAGTYCVVIEEEQIPDISFLAFHRIATLLHLPANPAPGRTRSVVDIDPAELAAALAADEAAARAG